MWPDATGLSPTRAAAHCPASGGTQVLWQTCQAITTNLQQVAVEHLEEKVLFVFPL